MNPKTKVFVNGKQIRTAAGRFDSFKAKCSRAWTLFRNTTYVTAATFAIFFAGQLYASNNMSVAFAETKVVNVLPEKIADLKAGVINQISDCERAGHTEAEGLIVFDSNARASLGVMQFQVKTVQQYEKILYGQDVSGKEAILIALDATKAKALAQDIVFEQDGLGNWLNCANKLGLRAQVNAINTISK